MNYKPLGRHPGLGAGPASAGDSPQERTFGPRPRPQVHQPLRLSPSAQEPGDRGVQPSPARAQACRLRWGWACRGQPSRGLRQGPSLTVRIRRRFQKAGSTTQETRKPSQQSKHRPPLPPAGHRAEQQRTKDLGRALLPSGQGGGQPRGGAGLRPDPRHSRQPMQFIREFYTHPHFLDVAHKRRTHCLAQSER